MEKGPTRLPTRRRRACVLSYSWACREEVSGLHPILDSATSCARHVWRATRSNSIAAAMEVRDACEFSEPGLAVAWCLVVVCPGGGRRIVRGVVLLSTDSKQLGRCYRKAVVARRLRAGRPDHRARR